MYAISISSDEVITHVHNSQTPTEKTYHKHKQYCLICIDSLIHTS